MCKRRHLEAHGEEAANALLQLSTTQLQANDDGLCAQTELKSESMTDSQLEKM